MKIKILVGLITLLFNSEIVNGLVMREVYQIEEGTVIGSMKMFGPFVTDMDADNKEELVINGSANEIYFYEFDSNYSFNLVYTYSDSDIIWTSGIGDIDNDGMKDMLVRNTTKEIIEVLEQSDSTSFIDSLVWQSDTIFRSIYCLGLTNKLKGDGMDRIYGAGIPELTTPTKGYGWYYFTCTGNNQYEILNTFEESTQIQSAMDIGDIDNDSLTEVILESLFKTQIFKYESVSTDDDSFEFMDSIMTYASPLCLLILPDVDGDGTNEIAEILVNYIGYPTSYKCVIFEGTDTIFNRDFEVETDNMLIDGGDIDYGDVDGDSAEEVVFSGGRHIEVWEATGDNQFEMMWEYTDPTYNTIQSHIKCHDFNKDGYDEIIFSGVGSSLGEEHTRIFEDSVAVNGIQESHELRDSTCTVPTNSSKDNAYISYTSERAGEVEIEIYNVTGSKVSTMKANVKEGANTIGLNSLNKSGIFFVKINSNGITETMRINIIK